MSCPHSSAAGASPERCSLCIQQREELRVQQVAINREGAVTVDGNVIGRLADLNRARQHEETQSTVAKRFKTCGNCGTPGHNRATCGREPRFN